MASVLVIDPTASSYSFTLTREKLAIQVLEKLRILSEGETPNDEDKLKVYDAIDARLKELHALGTLWFNVAGVATTLTLTPAINTVQLPDNILYPVTVTITDDGVNYPVSIIEHTDFHLIRDVTRSDRPCQFFCYDAIGYLYPIPDKPYTLNLTYERIAADTKVSTPPNVEVSMLRSLKNMVAYDLADTFNQPEDRIARFKAESDDAVLTIRKLNTKPRTPSRVKLKR
jgi:hypothetical protein